MKLLALDTSSSACVVAVQSDGDIYDTNVIAEREHTKILMPTIRESLAEAGLSITEVDAIILGNGPGSFIGMRIAASVVQGISLSTDIPIVAISSLELVAFDVFHNSNCDVVAVAQDAHMDQIYLGLYKKADNDRGFKSIGQERIEASTYQITVVNDFVAAGFGWIKYKELVENNINSIVEVTENFYPKSSALLELGKIAFLNGEVIGPDKLQPTYLRENVASKPK